MLVRIMSSDTNNKLHPHHPSTSNKVATATNPTPTTQTSMTSPTTMMTSQPPPKKRIRTAYAARFRRTHDEAWNSMYHRLARYKREHGDCLVPKCYKHDPKLGNWVHNQRHCRDSLVDERKQKLDNLGFVWVVVERDAWADMYHRLQQYKALHGDCLVPVRYGPDPKLGRWVREQRKTYLVRNMTKARQSQLENLGFVWRAPAGRRGPTNSSSISSSKTASTSPSRTKSKKDVAAEESARTTSCATAPKSSSVSTTIKKENPGSTICKSDKTRSPPSSTTNTPDKYHRHHEYHNDQESESHNDNNRHYYHYPSSGYHYHQEPPSYYQYHHHHQPPPPPPAHASYHYSHQDQHPQYHYQDQHPQYHHEQQQHHHHHYGAHPNPPPSHSCGKYSRATTTRTSKTSTSATQSNPDSTTNKSNVADGPAAEQQHDAAPIRNNGNSSDSDSTFGPMPITPETTDKTVTIDHMPPVDSTLLL